MKIFLKLQALLPAFLSLIMSLPVEGYAQAFDGNDLIDVDDSNYSDDEIEWFNTFTRSAIIGREASQGSACCLQYSGRTCVKEGFVSCRDGQCRCALIPRSLFQGNAVEPSVCSLVKPLENGLTKPNNFLVRLDRRRAAAPGKWRVSLVDNYGKRTNITVSNNGNNILTGWGKKWSTTNPRCYEKDAVQLSLDPRGRSYRAEVWVDWECDKAPPSNADDPIMIPFPPILFSNPFPPGLSKNHTRGGCTPYYTGTLGRIRTR